MRVSFCGKLAVVVFCVLAPRASRVDAAESLVTFRLHAPRLPEDQSVYITGSIREVANWQPGKLPMRFVGQHIWEFTCHAADDETIEYKYTLGSWDREGAGADGRPLPNFSLTVRGPTTRNDEIDFWTTGEPRQLLGQITGTVRYHRALVGDGILPRDIIVWLPSGYDDAEKAQTPGATRYPVLYMHDGQNIIDPATSSFGADWEVDETCTRLIAEKRIPPLIVVGIYNTPDRNKEYLPGPTGTAYMEFVARQLKPFIDAHYRTSPNRETTFVGGSSAGGLSAFMLAWEHPDVFSGAICMSPAFRMEKNDSRDTAIDFVSTVEKTEPPKQPVFFYIDIGGVGLEANLQPGVDAMLAALKSKGFKDGRDFLYVRAPDAKHFEGAWAARFPTALESMFHHHAQAEIIKEDAEK